MAPRTESPYWNPRHETLPRPELEALQVAKLRRLVAFAKERSSFHRERLAGVEPDSIRGLPDLARIPFTTRDTPSSPRRPTAGCWPPPKRSRSATT